MSSEGVKRFGTSAKTVRQKVYVEMKLNVSCNRKNIVPQGSMYERLEGCIIGYFDRSLNTEKHLYFDSFSAMLQRCAAKAVSS